MWVDARTWSDRAPPSARSEGIALSLQRRGVAVVRVRRGDDLASVLQAGVRVATPPPSQAVRAREGRRSNGWRRRSRCTSRWSRSRSGTCGRSRIPSCPTSWLWAVLALTPALLAALGPQQLAPRRFAVLIDPGDRHRHRRRHRPLAVPAAPARRHRLLPAGRRRPPRRARPLGAHAAAVRPGEGAAAARRRRARHLRLLRALAAALLVWRSPYPAIVVGFIPFLVVSTVYVLPRPTLRAAIFLGADARHPGRAVAATETDDPARRRSRGGAGRRARGHAAGRREERDAGLEAVGQAARRRAPASASSGTTPTPA